jgi:hypothetical protein
MRRLRRLPQTYLVIALVIVVAAGLDLTLARSSHHHAVAVAAGWVAEARADLPRLSLAQPVSGGPRYDRVANFGQAWSYDLDGNHCDTRDDVLARDMTGAQLAPDRCTVLLGQLHDPYTGFTIAFDRQHASLVQIDHVVPLHYAWLHGASGWGPAERGGAGEVRRMSLANDPLNLLAVAGRENQRKGDRGPADYMPPQRGSACLYATRFVLVAFRYHISVTTADRDVLGASLSTCPEEGS